MTPCSNSRKRIVVVLSRRSNHARLVRSIQHDDDAIDFVVFVVFFLIPLAFHGETYQDPGMRLFIMGCAAVFFFPRLFCGLR